MLQAGAIVLAGGRSTRMGRPKAALSWHGSTLLRRVTGIVARATAGPVVVVRAPGQRLPALPCEIEVAQDEREGRGPLQGLAAGLAALAARDGPGVRAAYVSAADVPLLHPRFVTRVLEALEEEEEAEVALPELLGHRQPLAAAYRLGLLDSLRELVGADRLRPDFLFERARVRTLTAEDLLADPLLARLDPELASVRNLNRPEDYERALALAAPEIEVRWGGGGRARVRAWSLGELARALRVALDEDRVEVTVNGERARLDAELPLAAGDEVSFTVAGPGG